MELDSRQRQYLKGLAHHLKPIVHVGKDGITAALLKQIEAALLQHELIKIKLTESSPLDRKAAAAELPAKTGAAFVQNIGRVFVLYREHPEEPTIDLPLPRALEAQEEGAEPDSEAVTSEPVSGITFGPSVRQRGATTPKPVAPAIRERPELDSDSDEDSAAKPKAAKAKGGRAVARPRSKSNKPPRSMQQRRGTGKKKRT